jgi:hypothetical protein
MNRLAQTAALVIAAPFVWLVAVIAMTLHLLAEGVGCIGKIWR